MTGSEESFVVPLLGALQAAISVLLTIFSGVASAQFGWLSERSSKEISKLCVTLMLPLLLIHNVGSQMSLDSVTLYVPIIIWAIIYNIVSIAIGLGLTKLFRLPSWVAPAITFNNTTALPLLLVQSLDSTGILDSIDPFGDAVSRAKSYFLMNAMIGNSLTFALGPKLLNGQNEDAPDDKKEEVNEEDHANGRPDPLDREIEAQESEAEDVNEESSLLPSRIIQPITRAQYSTYNRGRHILARLPPWAQTFLDFLWQFFNPPLIGACIGIIIGVVPALHRLFFNSPEEGGYFNAWLTSAIKSIGELFAALQVLVVGVKLSTSLVRMKKGEAAGDIPWSAMTLVLVLRFIVWPALSIPIIYAVASKTTVLGDDPLLWFCMMLMPTGPPALKLTALADVNGAGDEEKMTIAKFLAISYAVSPVICFAVVGSLKASQAAMA